MNEYGYVGILVYNQILFVFGSQQVWLRAHLKCGFHM